MPIKRGHVAPQNTYIVTLIRNFDPQCNCFLAANALLHTKPIIYCSESLCDLLGYSKSQMMLKAANLRFIFKEGVGDECIHALNHALCENREMELCVTLPTKSGAPITCKISVTPVRDENGLLPIYLLFFHVDEPLVLTRNSNKKSSMKARFHLKSLKYTKSRGDSIKSKRTSEQQTLFNDVEQVHSKYSGPTPSDLEVCPVQSDSQSPVNRTIPNQTSDTFEKYTSERLKRPRPSSAHLSSLHYAKDPHSNLDSSKISDGYEKLSSRRRRPATWCRVRTLSETEDVVSHRPASARILGLHNNTSSTADSEALRLVLSTHPEPTKASVSEKFAQFLSMDEDLRVEHRFQSPHMHRFTLKHYSVFKAIWDWIILALILYTAIATPFVTVFLTNYGNKYATVLPSLNRSNTSNDTISSGDPLGLSRIVDIMVDVMFFIDIFINFRTTYVNKNDEVVSHPRRIATHYVKGWFFIDLVAAIPFDLIFFQSARDQHTTLTSLLKAARLLRLVGIVRKLDRYSEYGASILLLLTALFALIAHWLACIWYAIGNAEHQYRDSKIGWLDTLAQQTNQTYQPGDPHSGPDLKTKYITALYFTFSSLTSIGFGNVSPNTNAEKVFSIIVMLVGSLMYASIFGNVGALIQRLYSGTARYHAQMLRIKEFIRFHQIPSPLRQRLEEYSTQVWEHTNGIDMTMVQYSFPESLQSDICLYVYRDILGGSPAFKSLNDGCLRNLSLRIRAAHMPPSDTLIHTGDLLTSVYYVVKGSLEVVTTDDMIIGVLNPGDFFGGLPTLITWKSNAPSLSGCPPSVVGNMAPPPKSKFAVRALTYTDVQFIDRHDFADLCQVYPELCTRLIDRFELTIPLVLSGCQSAQQKSSSTPWLNSKTTLDAFLTENSYWNTVVPSRLSDLCPFFHRRPRSRNYFNPDLPLWELERLQRMFDHGVLYPDGLLLAGEEFHTSVDQTATPEQTHRPQNQPISDTTRKLSRSGSDSRALYHLVTRFEQLEKQIERLETHMSSTIATILHKLESTKRPSPSL